LFNTNSLQKIEREGLSALNDVPLLRATTENEISYTELHAIFEAAYCSNEPVPNWYEREIRERIEIHS
jgi:hypothetical protein